LIASAAAAGVPLAICSGALRKEIELAAETVGVRRHFAIIVAAEDVAEGKPDPQGYLLALRLLRQAMRRDFPPAKCVVVEDSSAGIEAAHAAGMKVLAVATSYPAAKLSKADRVVESLTEITVNNLSKWFG
jgi:beta-phosphoglucomutase